MLINKVAKPRVGIAEDLGHRRAHNVEAVETLESLKLFQDFLSSSALQTSANYDQAQNGATIPRDKKLRLVSARKIESFAARAFVEGPEAWAAKAVALAGDEVSFAEAWETFKKVVEGGGVVCRRRGV